MAGLNVTVELRPCLVGGKKHLFHRWSWRAWTIAPSPLMGGDPGGQASVTMAIVEDEFGQIREVYPRDVRFIDNKVAQYDFGPDTSERCTCYHEENGHAECWGTRERDLCSCGGDKTKCTFYAKEEKGDV